jgi:Flp pilus assembly protein TadG
MGRERRGAAAVEFALCASIFVMLIFAIIEFAGLLQIQHAVRQAALEGARTGITLDATATSTQAQATNILNMSGLTAASTPTVVPNPLTYTSSTVSVTVSVDPANNSWYKYFLPAGNLITSTITLEREVDAISVP